MENDDRLLLMVVNKLDFVDPGLSKKWSMFDELFLEAANKLTGGYMQIFYYDCRWITEMGLERLNFPKAWGQNCFPTDEEAFNPLFTIMKPPYTRVNPYDGSKVDHIDV